MNLCPPQLDGGYGQGGYGQGGGYQQQGGPYDPYADPYADPPQPKGCCAPCKPKRGGGGGRGRGGSGRQPTTAVGDITYQGP